MSNLLRTIGRQQNAEMLAIFSIEYCNQKWIQTIWRLIQVQLYQAHSMIFNSNSGKFLSLIFSMFQCVLFLSLYQSWIVTSKVQRKVNMEKKSISYILDLLDEKDFRLLMPYYNHWYIRTSKSVREREDCIFYMFKGIMKTSATRRITTSSDYAISPPSIRWWWSRILQKWLRYSTPASTFRFCKTTIRSIIRPSRIASFCSSPKEWKWK